MGARRILVGVSSLVVVALAAAIVLWQGPASAALIPPLGDASCDDSVNSVDAALVLQLDAGLVESLPCPQNADVNEDRYVTSLDATLILQFDAGLIARCPDLASQDLAAELVLDGNQARFPHREPISLTLSITNCGDDPVSRMYSSSQTFDFIVRDADGQDVWRWSDDWFFAGVITYRTVQPGGTMMYTKVWNQQTNDGEQVAPGSYEVRGYDVGCNDTSPRQCDLGDSASIEIEP